MHAGLFVSVIQRILMLTARSLTSVCESFDMLIHTEDLGKARKHEHIKPLLQKLHWLPVVSRIQYKIATLCYSSFTESYPVHLSELLTVYHPSRQLRSISDTRTFRIPFTKTKTFGQRAFSFTDPTQWNSLLYDVRHSVSTSSFKQALKKKSLHTCI